MQQTLKIISLIFWIAYGGFVALSVATSLSSNRTLSLPFASYIVRSGSMEPMIMTGDIILIAPQASYTTNDVVTFIDAAGRTVTHRIIGESDGQFRTKGDNNQTDDPEPIPSTSIIGEYKARIPAAGYLLVYAQQPFGIFLLIALPIISIVATELFTKPSARDVKHQ